MADRADLERRLHSVEQERDDLRRRCRAAEQDRDEMSRRHQEIQDQFIKVKRAFLENRQRQVAAPQRESLTEPMPDLLADAKLRELEEEVARLTRERDAARQRVSELEVELAARRSANPAVAPADAPPEPQGEKQSRGRAWEKLTGDADEKQERYGESR